MQWVLLAAVGVGVMFGSMQAAKLAVGANTCSTAQATSGHDTCNGNDNVQTVDLKAGNDDFYLFGAGDTAYGNDGQDIFDGGAGPDVIRAGAGFDKGDDLETEEYEGVDSGNGNDYVDGGDGDDMVLGNGGVDEIYGGPGFDFVHADEYGPGGEADAVVDGGPGFDICFVNGSDLGVVAGCDGQVYVNQIE
jgi:Ca2+-binding RTX toxin-like protein